MILKRNKHKSGKNVKMNIFIFKRIFLYNLLILTLIVLIITFISFRLIMSERGAARVDLLKQISDNNANNRRSMVSVMDYAYTLVADFFKDEEKRTDETVLLSSLAEIQGQIDAFGFEYAIDIVLNDKRVYSSDDNPEKDLKNMLQSYWYIKHFSGESDTSWSLRYQDATNVESYSLCYARTLYDENDAVIGVVMLTTSSSTLFHTYQRLLDTDSTICILDENGIVISHSNSNNIGLWLYSLNYFYEQYPKDSYTLAKKVGNWIMISNYQDPDSGWLFIEEQPIREFFFSYAKEMFWVVPTFILVCLLTILQSYFAVRKVSKPLIECAHHMGFIKDDNFTLMTIQDQYSEIETLSRGYNDMLLRIRNLIHNIKEEEEQKREIEFAFLQAQINPHFLRNTLLGIKGLILMNRNDRAAEMISAFTEMLNIPIRANLQGHFLRDELQYVRHYVSLMQYRYGRKFSCIFYVEDSLEEFVIPPLILQPIVENAIFHGLAMKEDEEGTIVISASRVAANVQIAVEDNGGGMSGEQLENLWLEERREKHSVNNIGLANVLSRIKYVFGEASGIEVESEEGKGTTVRIVLVSKEKKDETLNC